MSSEKVAVLDTTGFVELLETFGSDLTVVNAARVSFAKESAAMTGADEKLIKYLAKHNHISPFFHPQLRFRLKMPIFVAREWFRHTVGFSRNEVSRRYIDTTPEQVYYRFMFESNFGKMHSTVTVPYFWMPRWSVGVTDPSARMLDVY